MPLPALFGAAALATSARVFVGYLITRAVVSLGVAFVVFQGIDFAFEELFTLALSYFSALPADILVMLRIIGVDVAINMLATTIISVITFKSLTGAFRSLTIGNPR